MKRMKRLVIASLLLAPALAFAQPKSADDWYKEGETQYNLGEFEKAAEAFKQGFASETDEGKKPAYLYNVAQSYRQANKCRDAAFFYKRYLALKDRDVEKPLKPDKRAEIEQRINELEACAKTQETIASKPPDNTIPLEGTGGQTGTGTPAAGTKTGPTVGQGEGDGEGEVDDGEDGGSVVASTGLEPRVVSARFAGGAAKLNAGKLDTPILASFALTAGYPVYSMNGIEIDAGAVFGYAPVPYTNSSTGEDKTASLMSALANVAVTYAVSPKIGIRGDVGAGVLVFGGISEMGNPFTKNAAGTSGALAMFNARVAASADYAITPNLVATVTPIAFSYSPPKEGLLEDIKSIIRLDFMVGIGYRM